jgi:hypothetical protein
MSQPAHDELPRSDQLLAVDAEVLPVAGALGVLRPARDDQAPGEQGASIARPAVLDGPTTQVDVLTFLHLLLTGRTRHALGPHLPNRSEHFQQLAAVLEAAGRLGLAQSGEQLPHLAQLPDILRPHAPGNALRGTEQIGQYRAVAMARPLEPQGRTLIAQHTVADQGHLQMRRNRNRDAPQRAARLQLREEFAQVSVLHGQTECTPQPKEPRRRCTAPRMPANQGFTLKGHPCCTAPLCRGSSIPGQKPAPSSPATSARVFLS